MKYFVKISIEGSFPSGVDDEGTYEIERTYEIPEKLYNRFISDLAYGIQMGVVKVI